MRDGTGSRRDAGMGSAWQLGRPGRRNGQCSRSRVELVRLLLPLFVLWRVEHQLELWQQRLELHPAGCLAVLIE
jgi:hypothetical protein